MHLVRSMVAKHVWTAPVADSSNRPGPSTNDDGVPDCERDAAVAAAQQNASWWTGKARGRAIPIAPWITKPARAVQNAGAMAQA